MCKGCLGFIIIICMFAFIICCMYNVFVRIFFLIFFHIFFLGDPRLLWTMRCQIFIRFFVCVYQCYVGHHHHYSERFELVAAGYMWDMCLCVCEYIYIILNIYVLFRMIFETRILRCILYVNMRMFSELSIDVIFYAFSFFFFWLLLMAWVLCSVTFVHRN